MEKWKRYKVTIVWGANKEDVNYYYFSNQGARDTFLRGVNEAVGWSEAEIITT